MNLAMTLKQPSCSMQYNLSTDDFTIPHSSRLNARIDFCEKTYNDNHKMRHITKSCD